MSDYSDLADPVVTLDLVCPPEAVAALVRHPALRGAKTRRPRARALRQTWHDTTGHGLGAQDLALVESAGLWRVERLGLGWPRRPGTPSPILASAVHPAGLEAKLGHPLPGPLHPVARHIGQLLRLTPVYDGKQLDCRIVSGTMTALTPHGADGRERAIGRAEIAGPRAAVLGLARALAGDLPVTPSLTTTAQEAFLLAGVRLRPLPTPPLDPGMPTEEALAILTCGLISTFLTRLGQIEARTGTEPVHQARVTLRRLHALMLAFRPVLKDAEAALKPRLGRLKEVLAPARDWDVFLSETVDPLARSLDAADAVTDWLRQAALGRREAAYAALTEWLHGPAYRDLAWQLVGLGLGDGWRPVELVAPPPEVLGEPPEAAAASAPPATPTAEAAANPIGPYTLKCLEHRWKKTARPARELAEMPAPELHGLRIKCKKLRYQAEMFQDVVPGKSGRRLIKRLAYAQETMGLLNDGAVATELVRSLRPAGQDEAGSQVLAAEAIGLIRGFGVGHARDSREAVIQAWRKLVRHDPF
jgi:CHAD domain-containing protein